MRKTWNYSLFEMMMMMMMMVTGIYTDLIVLLDKIVIQVPFIYHIYEQNQIYIRRMRFQFENLVDYKAIKENRKNVVRNK